MSTPTRIHHCGWLITSRVLWWHPAHVGAPGLSADQGSLHLSGIAVPEPEHSTDGDFWCIVHFAAYDQAHPLLAGA